MSREAQTSALLRHTSLRDRYSALPLGIGPPAKSKRLPLPSGWAFGYYTNWNLRPTTIANYMKTTMQRLHLPIVSLVSFVVGVLFANHQAQSKVKLLEAGQQPVPSSVPFSESVIRKQSDITYRGRSPASDLVHEELFSKANITEDDKRITREMAERRDRGEFILKNEPPLFRKLQEYDFGAIVSETGKLNAPGYDKLFHELGVTSEVSSNLQTHLEKIHLASLQAESAIAQVMDARFHYDQRVQSSLNEEQYQRYRETEQMRPAYQDVESIQAKLRETGLELSLGSEESVASLLSAANAVDDGYWHGPYHSLPQVKVGKESVVAWANARSARALNAADFISKNAVAFGLSEGDGQMIANYYQSVAAESRSFSERIVAPVIRESPDSRITPSQELIVAPVDNP